MDEWKIFLTIGEIIALFFLIGKPILKLNGTLTKLNLELEQITSRVSAQEKALKEQKEDVRTHRKELWKHEAEQDTKLADHEVRIKKLEHHE